MIAAAVLPLLLLGHPQESHEALLAPPAGWRGEILDFPLSFAPEIELVGYEELAFAPGMFEPESDSYFSYALALRIEGEFEVERAFLSEFLEHYYVGLCRAVAGGRGLELELDEIAVEVARTAEGFRAKIAMFDPFVTGEPLDLVLELYSHATPRGVEILGLASPLDLEAPVWGELHAVAERWLAARPANLLLNHVYFVLERETFEALRSAPLLRRLAVVEERETVRTDTSYTGLYLYGQNTYFEFLPDGAAGLSAGSTGLAFGIEREDGTLALMERLEKAGVSGHVRPITRALEDRQVPWFRVFGIEMARGPLTIFGMEYHPSFLSVWHGESQAGISRSAVLERYAEVLHASALRAEAPFVDIRVVDLALDEAQRERVFAVAKAGGHRIEVESEGWVVHAPGFQMRVRAASKPGGVTGIELELRAPIEQESLRLGSTTWSFSGRTARVVLR